MKEEIKNNALNDEALDKVAGGFGKVPGDRDPGPMQTFWCDDCKKNVHPPILSKKCPECGGFNLSEPH